MIYLWFPVGLILPTLCGWLALRVLEGNSPVLYRAERIAAAIPVGGVVSTYVMFLVHLSGIGSFSMLSMLMAQLLVCAVLGALYWTKFNKTAERRIAVESPVWKPWQKILLILLGAFFVAKMVAGFIFLIGPAYFDDVVSNWNMRGKAMYVQETMVFEFEPGKPDGVASYPPAVPLIKVWMAHLGGQWHEGLVNVIHMVWYFCLLVLFYYALRRMFSKQYALLGTYILSSIPLLTIHGAAAYAECFLALMLLLALHWLYQAVTTHGSDRMSYLKLGALVTGLLTFTKNEALLLHLPPILLFVFVLMLFRGFTMSEKRKMLTWYIASTVIVGLPWILYKRFHDLGFGNAKGITGLEIEYHPGVLQTIFANTFFEGNWSLLPVLFVALVILRWKTAFRTPLVIFTAFFWIVWAGQLPIYMFTPLYIEAVMQTGYARGIIHLIPAVVMVVTVLLHQVLAKRDA